MTDINSMPHRNSTAIQIIRTLHPVSVLETAQPGILTIAYCGDQPTDYMEDGILKGIHGEVRRRAADILDLAVHTVLMPFPKMLSALERREIDLPGIGTAWTARRAAAFRFTQPFQYFFFGIAESRHRQSEDSNHRALVELRGYCVAAIDGSFNNPEVADCLGPENVRLYPTLNEIVDQLSLDELDAAIYDFPNIVFELKRRGLDDKFRVRRIAFDRDYPLTTGRWANYFVFRGDAVRLQCAADLAIDFMKTSGELEDIYRSYGFEDERMLSTVP